MTTNIEDWSGVYLIVYEGEDAAVAFNGALETLDVASNNISVTINNGVIASDDATIAASVTIEAMDGGFSIKTSSDKYLNHTGTNNTLNPSETPVAHTISIDDDGYAVIAVDENYHIRYNATNGQERFRYYKTAANVHLYKKGEEYAVGVENINAEYQVLDLNAPMYNIVGQRVDASYKGIVIQNGQKYLLR